jgi:hypothetical protein
MSVRVRYLRHGEICEGSVEELLVHSGGASTRMMKYLIALTGILLRKKTLNVHDLNHLAHAYQADVKVLEVNLDTVDVDNAYDVKALK